MSVRVSGGRGDGGKGSLFLTTVMSEDMVVVVLPAGELVSMTRSVNIGYLRSLDSLK